MNQFAFFQSQKEFMSIEQTAEGSVLRLPPMTDDQYDGIKYIVESCGGHWRERIQGFFFECPAQTAQNLLNHVTEQSAQMHIDEQRFFIQNQFYETPTKIAREMVELADIQPTDLVLEPSAGRGALAKWIHQKTNHLVCIEANTENFHFLASSIATPPALLFQMRFETYFAQKMNIPASTKLLDKINDVTQKRKVFDKIVMNPPFGHELDLIHIQLAYKLLKPHGRLVALAAENSLIYKRPSSEFFQSFLEGVQHTITPLPYGSFKEAGTTVDVVRIIIDN